MSKPETLDDRCLGRAPDSSSVWRPPQEVDGYTGTDDLESISQYRVLGR